MGEVIKLNDMRKRRASAASSNKEIPASPRIVTGPDFLKAIMSDDNKMRVSGTIAKLCGLPGYRIEEDLEIGRVAGTMNFGTVYPELSRGRNNGLVVISTPDFPESLHTSAHFTRKGALNMAAAAVTGYGLFIRGQVNTRIKVMNTYASTQQEGIWSADYLGDNISRSLAYRAAGAIALHANQRKRINVEGEQPFPPHIAGMLNPLDKTEIDDLSEIFKAGALAQPKWTMPGLVSPE